MISLRGKYDGKVLKLNQPIALKSERDVIVTFLDEDISADEIQKITESSGSFDFLMNEAEDIYSDSDLKKKYPQ